MKIPEPIMEPMTSVVAEVRPRPLTKLACGFSGVIWLMFLSIAGSFLWAGTSLGGLAEKINGKAA